jgi:iron complex outermembrane receptor protein
MVSVQRLLGSAAVAALAVAVAPAARAADATTAQIQEVVVTALKRAENVQTVPISMEVVSGKAVEAFHADTLRQISVPNMNVQSVGGNDVIYIRGFGSPSQNYAFDQAVSLYVDGIYAGKSRQFMAPFFDLQRVEVLRGPQGALFGKNTAAGAISIISAQPTSTFQGEATGIYNFNLKGPEISGYVSGPVTDKLSARLAVRVVDQDGYIKNLALGGEKEPTNKSELARLSVKYTDAAFDYVAKVEWGHIKSHGSQTVAGPLTTEQQPKLTRYGADDIGRLGPAGFETTSWNVAGTGNLNLGQFVLTSVTGYSFFNATHVNSFDQTIPAGGVTPPTVFNSYPEHFRQWSQELRLQSPTGGKLDYIIGAYYDNAEYEVTQFSEYTIASLGYFLLNSRFQQKADSYSVFAQGAYHFSDSFRLLGSLRYSHTKKTGQFRSALLAGPFPLRPITSADGGISEGNTDPSITAQYDVAPHIMVYATYGQGSKSGGFVSNTYGTTNASFIFQPEHSKNYEVGAKSTLLDGTLLLNAAVYNTSFDNLQVSIYNATVQAYIVGNAAKARSRGVELTATWYPMPNLDFTALVAAQDVKYVDYPGAQCLASQTLAQCNPSSIASVAANNLAGSPLPNISKFSGSFQAHHVAELANNLRLSTTVAVVGRSKFFNADDESPLYGVQKAYAKVNARIELSPMDSRWRVALVGTNLTNELTTAGSFRLPAPITPVSRAIYWVEQGRNISIEAGMRF